MNKQNRVTTESLDKEAASIRRQLKHHKARQARKHLQDLEDLAAAVLKCYEAETGKTATIEELTAYFLDELKKKQ